MLVLTRREGEKIIVGNRLLTVTVLEIHDRWVKLGISAPKELSVHREEIYERIESGENKGNK